MVKYSIGIVTFDKRFDKYFKPLINSIPKDIEIITCVNGNYKEDFDIDFKRKMLSFLIDKDNVYPMFFTEFRGLSKLWNNCVLNATNDFILLLNDDLKIEPSFFKNLNEIIKNEKNSFKINDSWSHVFINRKELNEWGWFDERFLSIGNEDTDIERRYEILNKRKIRSIKINGIDNFIESKTVLRNQKKISKYSQFNRDFFCKKYSVDTPKNKNVNKKIKDITQYPYEKFYWDNKNNL